MMEQKFAVKPVGVKYVCDSCKGGDMVVTSNMKMLEDHIEYIHKCNRCGLERGLNDKYPLVRYEQV
ncbi:hypothetical protein CON85_23610 [Bacillus toyonensis]|nr:hypothetical protein BTGOE5_34830 [Bacillus thuringiensis]PDZ26465.1 hypothetical protein CON85_23610 [Bacillus toyonensis]OFC97498.1 hypothetical protein BTGOE5_35380 [Bacillus thuringiensis]PEI74745.1 hypothetical protein CN674_12085 [Bacillus toyonensis]PFY25185.1 hypothetical protein COL44_15230 [Bacillus toyonensis]